MTRERERERESIPFSASMLRWRRICVEITQ